MTHDTRPFPRHRTSQSGRRLPAIGRFALLLLVLSCAWPADAAAKPQVYRDRVVPHWSADGERFWYRNTLPDDRREFVLVDAAGGKRSAAFDHDRVAAGLATLTGSPVDAARLPIDALAFGDTPAELLLASLDGAVYHVDLRDHTLKVQSPAGGAPHGSITRVKRLDAARRSRGNGDESGVTFFNQTGEPFEVFWVDPRGERQPYFTLKHAERHTVQTFEGHVWVAVGRDGKDIAAFEATADDGVAVIESKPSAPAADTDTPRNPDADQPPRRRGERRTRGGSRSPDGKWVLTARENNLFIAPAGPDGGEPLPLTSDGKPGDDYSTDRVSWSPDGASLVAIRLDDAPPHEVRTVESSPRDRVEPRLRTMNYLKPGDTIAHPRPMLFHVADRRWIPVSDTLFPTPWSIQDVRWSADSSRFTFVYNQRGHQVLRIVAVDAATGAASSLVEEGSATFIDYSGKFFCRWLGDDELLWASERDGYNHLYLYDAKTGQVKNQVTRGEWVVQDVDRVDTEARQLYFRAGGVRPGQDPYYTHACRVNLDGTGFVVLTEGDGTHAVDWSPDGRYLIDRWSRIDQPPVTELRRATDGAAVCPLESADAREVLEERGGRWPVRLSAKGRDGKTDIYGAAWLPGDFDPAKTYPVLECVYAGPQDFFTPKRFAAGYGERQRLADLGMIVVQADGMGTSGRSKAFHDVCWKNLKDAGFEDRIALIRAAAKDALPQMDLSRVGIYGGSAGGQNAMAALLWHNDFYKVAVADCGCHDNRMDKIWWNEQWMGWPVDDSYARSSNVVNARLMKGKLMLIVGELDDNVDPSSTFQAAAALQRAGKDFELVVVTGTGHGAAETPFGSMKRTRFLQRHLLGKTDE